MPERLELPAQLGMIVDFAVEDQDGVAVVAAHRLVAVAQVNDLQAHGTKRDVLGLMSSLLVRAAMDQRRGGALDGLSARLAMPMCKPSYSTHVSAVPSPRSDQTLSPGGTSV